MRPIPSNAMARRGWAPLAGDRAVDLASAGPGRRRENLPSDMLARHPHACPERPGTAPAVPGTAASGPLARRRVLSAERSETHGTHPPAAQEHPLSGPELRRARRRGQPAMNLNRDLPKEPVDFSKPPTVVVGPEDPVVFDVAVSLEDGLGSRAWRGDGAAAGARSRRSVRWSTSSATPASTTARSGTSSSSTRSPPARTSTRRAALGPGSSPPTRSRTRRGSI